jgi:hypothetical protein
MTDEWLIVKDLEKSDRGQIVFLPQHLLGRVEENHENPQSG